MTSDIVSIDLETKAVASLPSVGVHRYTEDPYFQIYFMAYAFNDEEPELWEPGKPFPKALVRHASRGGMFHAWNAQFERVCIGKQFANVIDIKRSQWRCTMIRSYACGLPGKLEMAAKALGVNQQKDTAGSRAMRKLMRPRNWQALKKGEETKPTWFTRADSPELFDIVGAYCQQDVRTERECGKFLPYLPPHVEKQYWYDQLVSDRGIRIDVELCRSAVRIAKVRSKELQVEAVKISGYKPTQVAKLKAWMAEQGVPMANFKAPTVERMLAAPDLPPKAAAILRMRQEAGKTSVSKYETALAYMCKDGKIRGQRQFYGAHTGRFAGRGVQLDNLMRPTMKADQIDDVVAVVRCGESWLVESVYDNVMEPVANATRSILIADPGQELYVGDFKSIESRKLAETSGQKSTLDAWRASDEGRGADVYVMNAASMFNVPVAKVDKDLRFWGKTAELTLGYQGGVRPLINQTEKSNAKFRDIYDVMYKNADAPTREKVDWLYKEMGEGHERDWKAARFVVERWRQDNYMTVKLWRALERASVAAMQRQGETVRCTYTNPRTGREHDTGISFRYDKQFKMLFCNLKSGRAVIYPRAHLVRGLNHRGEEVVQLRAFYWNGKFNKWMRYHPYGGFMAENVTQAESRDIMVEAAPKLEAVGFKLLHTIHDELITQGKLGLSIKTFEKVASVTPAWARTMPVAIEAWHGPAYKKG